MRSCLLTDGYRHLLMGNASRSNKRIGAFLLHKAGFLKGKRAATYFRSREQLREMGDVTVVEDRWVHDGNVITAGGVSSGIDMALYMLGVIKTPEFARKVQQHIEYDPAPPYAEVEVS